jgi:hypothetical protein
MTDIEQFLMSLRTHKDADGKLKPIYLADTIKEEIQIIEEAIKYSQRWVGLTKEEAKEISMANRPYVIDMIAALEARLKEKNT